MESENGEGEGKRNKKGKDKFKIEKRNHLQNLEFFTASAQL